ncbi:hypothetical protein IFM89_039181 [Coptis chinensis]|uniref:Uncharacterized protein n=1 Tax=Coptis chinensis TaxID=261450 RepID=A0A835LFS9_9MAGN|nr:hypothetical protein IFM89_039181 [Coptis chinensis]
MFEFCIRSYDARILHFFYCIGVHRVRYWYQHKGPAKNMVNEEWFEKQYADPSRPELINVESNFRIEWNNLQIIKKDTPVRLGIKRDPVFDKNNAWVDTQPKNVIDFGGQESSILKIIHNEHILLQEKVNALTNERLKSEKLQKQMKEKAKPEERKSKKKAKPEEETMKRSDKQEKTTLQKEITESKTEKPTKQKKRRNTNNNNGNSYMEKRKKEYEISIDCMKSELREEIQLIPLIPPQETTGQPMHGLEQANPITEDRTTIPNPGLEKPVMPPITEDRTEIPMHGLEQANPITEDITEIPKQANRGLEKPVPQETNPMTKDTTGKPKQGLEKTEDTTRLENTKNKKNINIEETTGKPTLYNHKTKAVNNNSKRKNKNKKKKSRNNKKNKKSGRLGNWHYKVEVSRSKDIMAGIQDKVHRERSISICKGHWKRVEKEAGSGKSKSGSLSKEEKKSERAEWILASGDRQWSSLSLLSESVSTSGVYHGGVQMGREGTKHLREVQFLPTASQLKLPLTGGRLGMSLEGSGKRRIFAIDLQHQRMIIGKGDETWKRHSISSVKDLTKISDMCTFVVPMDVFNLLLGPWQFDRESIHDGVKNTHLFLHKGGEINLGTAQTTGYRNHYVRRHSWKARECEEEHDSFLDTPPIFYEYGADESEFCVTTPSLSGNLFIEYADPVWEDFDINYSKLFRSVHLKLQLEETSKRMWLFNLYYSSWPLFALSHHFLVWYCAELVYPGREFRRYAVLGDDVVIADPLVAKRNEEALGEFQVEISRQKSLISSTGSFEFAKRFFVKNGSVDLSPISIRTLMSFMSPFGLMGISYPSLIKNLLRICGMGYKVIALLNHNASKRVRRIRAMWGLPRGLSSLSFEIWLGHSLSLSEGSSSGILAI